MARELSLECSDPRCEGVTSASSPLTVYYCSTCDRSYCEKCWRYAPVHRGDPSRGSAKHTRLDPRKRMRYDRLRSILVPTANLDETRQLHEEDENTTWFGIGKYESSGLPFLQDFPTYTQIMSSLPESNESKFPQLVSFVGETGAGKSTLIKLLIDNIESRDAPQEKPKFRSPVPGSSAIDDSISTSGDVHLYLEPGSFKSNQPILYADCEGLSAAERPPLATKIIKKAEKSDAWKYANMIAPTKIHPLVWATTDETRTRKYAVTHIYPRLLYTFSDVVVFVCANPRKLESVLLRLLDWAQSPIESSTNQGRKPHVIIAINKTSAQVAEGLWNVAGATKHLLDAMNPSIDPYMGNPKCIRLADEWRHNGAHIQTAQDLILRYYSSVRAVRLPDEHDIGRLFRQVEQLQQTIVDRCQVSHAAKDQSNLLADEEEFGYFIQEAFQHFSKRSDRPFDFKEVAFRRNPVTHRRGGHILRLAVAMARRCFDEKPEGIFRELSRMVASCILYDCIIYRKGKPQDLFEEYSPMIESALNVFCSEEWPCEYVKRGLMSSSTTRCVNVRTRHSDFHQNRKGAPIGTGGYMASFKSLDYMHTWKTAIKECFNDLHNILEASRRDDPSSSFREQIKSMHQEIVADFHNTQSSGGTYKSYLSHESCVLCLMRTPDHALACGHVLCTECAKTYGELKAHSIWLPQCPVHRRSAINKGACKIMLKPEHVGVRVLSLDGGGIRGIVELEILLQIERSLGVKIPIVELFDLIVGTSTGGIIALALGVKRFSVDDCIVLFKDLCNTAFTPRFGHNVPGVKQIMTLHHGSEWETSPLYAALNSALGQNYLFGGEQVDETVYNTKVSITSTAAVDTTPIILSNYRCKGRAHIRRGTYEQLGAVFAQDEFKVWEAAAATSAASPYFKPFDLESTGQSYIDGAFWHNNPVKIGQQERKLIWPDVAERPPDLLVSLGTSQHAHEVEELKRDHKVALANSKSLRAAAAATTPKASKKWRHLKGVWHFGKSVVRRLHDIVDAELAWQEFIESSIKSSDKPDTISRYVRINPDIKRTVPPLFAKEQVPILQQEVRNLLQTQTYKIMIQNIKLRLIASCFYFQKSPIPARGRNGLYTYSGKILCRFEETSNNMRELGRFLQYQQNGDSQPKFVIQHGQPEAGVDEIDIAESLIRRMISHGEFAGQHCDIHLSAQNAHANASLVFTERGASAAGYPLSGFPRDFLSEKSAQDSAITRVDSIEDDIDFEKDDALPGTESKLRQLRSLRFGSSNASRENVGPSEHRSRKSPTPDFGRAEANVWSAEGVSPKTNATTPTQARPSSSRSRRSNESNRSDVSAPPRLQHDRANSAEDGISPYGLNQPRISPQSQHLKSSSTTYEGSTGYSIYGGSPRARPNASSPAIAITSPADAFDASSQQNRHHSEPSVNPSQSPAMYQSNERLSPTYTPSEDRVPRSGLGLRVTSGPSSPSPRSFEDQMELARQRSLADLQQTLTPAQSEELQLQLAIEMSKEENWKRT